MAIHSIKNQYVGINAHLNSQLQNKGGWDNFHSNHIADLTRLMRRQLAGMGYTAESEQGLQIRHKEAAPKRPESDVTIYDTNITRANLHPMVTGSQNVQDIVLQIPVMLALEDEIIEYYRAIGIYEAKQNLEKGQAVAWVELLSPSNKPSGQHYEDYRQKRLQILQSGLVFVEIDYLHQFAPTYAGVANYRHQDQPISFPYRITVSEPRPDFWEGHGYARQFRVDEMIPTIRIPLSTNEHFEFNFDVAYQKTYQEMVYGHEINYQSLPINFDSYQKTDQLRIVRRMLTVLEAAKSGMDLEQAPLPLHFEEISIEDGLKRIESINSTK